MLTPVDHSQSILDTIIVICSEQSDRPATASSNLVTDLGLDSLDLVSITFIIEQHWPSIGPIDHVPEFMQTVNDVALFVEAKLVAAKAKQIV